MSLQMVRVPKIAFAAVLLAAVSVQPATAQSLDGVVIPSQTCTTINCNALVLNGRVNGFARPNSSAGATANPWVASFNPGPITGLGCLRFAVTAEQDDLAMAVVGPTHVIYTNDDSGCKNGSSLCPRVVVRSLSAGFYTVVLNHVGGASIESNFTLNVGRYSKNTNPNCAGATAGRISAAKK
jgi:hypothetical protein